MQMYKDYKSPLGYEVGEDGIDSYGVNHNGFSTRDELEYQMARQNREQQLIQNYNNQGITENYPQYGTNFWGDNAYDNYGFGNSDISGNVQNVTNKLNGTDYSVLPDYSIGSANSYNNTGGYNNYANYNATDYTVNTENLMGKPSSYFQNNNSVGWSGNTDGFGSSTNSGFNQNTNFGENPRYGTTPTLQTQTPSPWSSDAIPQAQTPSPWQNNKTVTPWNGGYDLSKYPQVNNKQIDYSLYGADFTKEFIDKMENDAEFQKILNEYIIPNEGGYSNRLNDRGKKTNYGISQKTYYNEDIPNLTRERANAIIYRDFYDWNGLNKLPYPIRGFVVDYGMPTSPLNAIQTVHKVIGLPPNGNIIGKDTLGKLENYTEDDYNNFLNNYRKEMYKYYYDLVEKDATQKENLRGWLNRADRAHLAK